MTGPPALRIARIYGAGTGNVKQGIDFPPSFGQTRPDQSTGFPHDPY